MRIIGESHTDHVKKEHLDYIMELFGSREDRLAVETVQLPDGMPPLMNSLYGPSVGDDPVQEEEVYYATRPGRAWESRMVNRPVRATMTMTVVFGDYKDFGCVLFTAYGGPAARRELGDPNLLEHERAATEEFWREHALSADA